MAQQSWEVVRKHARRLETDIESKLVELSKLASSLHTSRSSALDARTSADGDEGMQRRNTAATNDAALTEQMTSDMQRLLHELSQTIHTMRDLTQQQQHAGSKISATSAHTLQRHTEILRDYTQEFNKTTSMIGTQREHTELMQGVTTGAAHGNASQSELERLYAERGSISNASDNADMALASGMSLKEDLDRQRAMFASMVERMESMSEGLPSIQRLIGQIRRKRKRDMLILATVVALLLFFTACWKLMM